MKDKDKKNTVTKSDIVKSYYAILDDDTNNIVKDDKPGFVAIFLFIEGDVKDLRYIGLN